MEWKTASVTRNLSPELKSNRRLLFWGDHVTCSWLLVISMIRLLRKIKRYPHCVWLGCAAPGAPSVCWVSPHPWGCVASLGVGQLCSTRMNTLSHLGKSWPCWGPSVCSQILTRQVLLAEGKRGRGGMVCPKEDSSCLTTRILLLLTFMYEVHSFPGNAVAGTGRGCLKPISLSVCRMNIHYSLLEILLPWPWEEIFPFALYQHMWQLLLQPLLKFPWMKQDVTLPQEWVSTL